MSWVTHEDFYERAYHVEDDMRPEQDVQGPVCSVADTGWHHDAETLYDDRNFELNDNDSVYGIRNQKMLPAVSLPSLHLSKLAYVEEWNQISNVYVPLVIARTLHVHHGETDGLITHSI